MIGITPVEAVAAVVLCALAIYLASQDINRPKGA